MRLTNILLCAAATIAMATAQTAETKPQPAKKSAGGTYSVLHPEMKVAADAGTYQKPMGTMGEKGAQPWTDTTINAGVDKKPEPGHVTTATGEIIDLSCYLQLGKHGEKHVSCGKKCLQNNQPIGLLTRTGTVYMLMAEEHDPRRDGQTTFREDAVNHLGHIMQVTGTETQHAGIRAIYVMGYVKK